MIDEPCANSTTIERLESLLYGIEALDQHVSAAALECAKLVTQVLRSELEQLIADCKANDIGSPFVSTMDQHDGVYVLQLRFPLTKKD